MARRRRQYNLQRKDFTPGAQVWLFSPAGKLNVSRKLNLRWSGPWTILRQVNPVLYEVRPHPNWHFPRSSLVVSVDRLALYTAPRHTDRPPLNLPPPLGADLSMPGDDYAEFINDCADADDDPPPASPPPPQLGPSPPPPPDGPDDGDDDGVDDSDDDEFEDAASTPGSPLPPSQRGTATPRGAAAPAPQPSSSGVPPAPGDGLSSPGGVVSPPLTAPDARRWLHFEDSPEQAPTTAVDPMDSGELGARRKRTTAGRPPSRYSPSSQKRGRPPPLPPKPRLDMELFPDRTPEEQVELRKLQKMQQEQRREREARARKKKEEEEEEEGASIARGVKDRPRRRKTPERFSVFTKYK